MKTIKPMMLSVATRSFEIKRTYHFGVSTFLFFDLSTGETLPETAMWQFAAEELGKDLNLDAGIPKSNAEYLISGYAFTPNGTPQETCPVTARVGNLSKTVYVIGDRIWKGREQTKPTPFTKISLTWDRAFGGEGYTLNPTGKGFAPVETEHGPIHYLPNLESPNKMLTSPKKSVPPISFGPIDITSQQRMEKAGTYDKKWLKNDFPGFARDMDWTFHNIASPDQRQSNFFTGQETFEFTNMHPTQSQIMGRLPNVRSRTFITQQDAGSEKFYEIKTNLTTIWFFPHALKGILIFQGSHICKEDDASDIQHLIIASETIGQERPVSHYQTVLKNRLDKDLALIHALREEDLLHPIEVSDKPKDEISKMKELLEPDFLLQKNINKATNKKIIETREELVALGLNPDEHGPKMPSEEEGIPSDPQELQDLQKQLIKNAQKEEKRIEEFTEKVFEEISPALVAAGIDPQMIRDEVTEGHIGPPEFSADGEIARFQQLAEECRTLGTTVDELEDWATNEKVHQGWRESEASIRETYLFSAHLQSPAPTKTLEESEEIRRLVLERYLASESFDYFDLTGANLSGLDLRGADFRHGWLESVDFTGTDLSGANFSNAVLARANLSNATCAVTNFNNANLGRATLLNFNGKNNSFEETSFYEANLTGADFSGATISKADFFGAKIIDTDFTEATLKGVTFSKNETKNLKFTKATLDEASFIDCDIKSADFYKANFNIVTFVKCIGSKINFCEARGNNISFAQCEPFPECDFRGAHVKTLFLRGLDLRESNFSGANLNTVDFSEANLENSKFYRAIAHSALFIRTNLQNADMTSADLFEANLQKADIRGTKFLGSNLYGANFGKVHNDEKTIFTDANQNKVTIYPLRHQ